MITKDELSSVGFQKDSPNLYHKKFGKNSDENIHVDIGQGFKG